VGEGVNILLLLLTLNLGTDYPSGTIAGVLAFDVVYNGLRVGIFSEEPFYEGFFKGGVLGFCQFGAKLLDAHQTTDYFHLPIRVGFSVCNSIANNLQFRRAPFKQLDFSFGLGTYHYIRGESDYVSIAPVSVGTLIYVATQGTQFEVGKTLLSGYPVFSYSGDDSVCRANSAACYVSGNVLLRNDIERSYKQLAFNHELNHAVFDDSMYHLDEAIDNLIPFRFLKYVEFNKELTYPMFLLPYSYRPNEIEAYTLTGQR
jgi:hypothetical protein